MRTEDTGQYAWKRTLIFEPAQKVLWWDLPISSAVGYWFQGRQDESVEIVVQTPYGEVSSLVRYSRAILLQNELDRVLLRKDT